MAIRLPESPTESLALPGEDPKPGRRAHQLSEAQNRYAYTYAKPNLRGLAMCEKLSVLEIPTPAWLGEATERYAWAKAASPPSLKIASRPTSRLGWCQCRLRSITLCSAAL